MATRVAQVVRDLRGCPLRRRHRQLCTTAECISNGAEGLSASVKTLPVNNLSRPWVHRPDPAVGKPCFTVLSYNILAEHLAHRHSWLYPYCSPEHLDGARRLGTVKKELTTWLPDIMCLQEVSCFHNELAPFLHEHGYTGRFIKRTGEKLLDGCALFYNHHKFEVRHYEEIEFRVPGDLVLKGDNVAQVAVLHNREAGASVVVANTHILYAPARGDVKLLQLKRLFRTLEQARLIDNSDPMPVVVCGDFNSTPGSLLLSDFVIKGQMSFIHMVGANRRRLSGQLPASRYQDTSHIAHSGYDYGKEPDITQDGTGNDPLDLLKHLRSVDDPPLDTRPVRDHVTVRHSLGLSSAYDYRTDSTTYHQGFKGVVDYLLYTRSHLRLEGVLKLAPPKVFRQLGGIPNEDFPSDHQPLLANFSFGDSGYVKSLR